MPDINCEQIAERILKSASEDIKQLWLEPRLAIVQDGNIEDDDELYLRGIIKDAERLGIHVGGPADGADGILYLGKSWSDRSYLNLDVDGVSIGNTMSVAEATLEIALSLGVSGSALVIGRGRVGRDVARLLLDNDFTVTVCHSKTEKSVLYEQIQFADLVVIAAGGAKFHGDSFTRKHTVIDISGSVDGFTFATITPKSGGIGRVTRAILLSRLVEEAVKKSCKASARRGKNRWND